MELRHLRYFLSVAEHLNYSEASRRLHVAQPAISQTILDLEKELGVSLLLRTRRTVELTAAGKAFLEEALEIVRRSESAKGAAQRAARGEIGALSIGYLPCTGQILPDLIRTYRGRFPNVTIELHEMSHEQQLEAFDDKRINLGFLRSIPRELESDFNVELVYNDRLEIAMPSKHPLAKNKAVHLKDLAKERFVEFHRRGAPGVFDEVIAVCRRAGFSPNIISEYDGMSSVMVSVESGLGVSVVPGCVGHLNNPGAILRPIKPASSRLPLCAIWSKSANAPVVDCFLEALRITKPAIRKKMERPS
jgi:DNA-binding transcriptional LysR family regulator